MKLNRRFLIAAAVILLTCSIFGCAGGLEPTVAPPSHTALNLVVIESQGAEFSLVETGVGTYDLIADAPQGMTGYYVELHYPAAYTALRVQPGDFLGQDALFLGIESRADYTPLVGVKLGADPEPEFGGGVVASITLGPAQGNVRRLSDVYAPPSTLVAAATGADVDFSFDQHAPGDSNQDGLTNGLDVFLLAVHFNHTSNWNGNTATDAQDDCVDLNRDGNINGLDLFLIATNFDKGVSEYRLEVADQGDEIYTTAQTVAFEAGDCVYYYQGVHQPGGGDWYYRLRSYHGPSDTLSAPSAAVAVTVNPISITSPLDDVFIEGMVTVLVDVPVTTDEVHYTIGGSNSILENTPPFSHTFDSTLQAEGPLTISILAYDGVDELGGASVTPIVDNVDPVVAFTSPDDLDTISDYTLLSADASDANGIAWVEFYADGAFIATDSVAPYEYNWDSFLAANGSVQLEARATDNSGKEASDFIDVTVNNPTALRFVPYQETYSVDDNVVVMVYASNVTDLFSVNARCYFDDTRLTFVDVVRSYDGGDNLLTNSVFGGFSPASDLVAFNNTKRLGDPGETGAGPVAYLLFTATAAGAAQFSFLQDSDFTYMQDPLMQDLAFDDTHQVSIQIQ